MVSELKPCPFCGGEADLLVSRASEDSMFAQVYCTGCSVETDEFEDAYAPREDAIAAWNRRVSPSQVAPANPAQVTELAADKIPTWPQLKNALWDVVTFEQLNDGHYINAYDLTDKLYFAITAAIGAGRSSEPEFETAPDNGTPAEVLGYVLDCARRWVPEARIIGNARAGDIERAIAAISAGGQAVAVKPLEWEGAGGDGKMSIRADAIGLRYYIYLNADDGLWHAYTEGYQMENFGEHTTKELAQKAVQSGHERRILSALSQPHPADERVVEALRQDVSKLLQMIDNVQSRPRMESKNGIYHPNSPMAAQVEKIRSSLAKEGL